MNTIVKMPDLGDIDAAEIIEILVKVGDSVEKESPICVVESEKASMEVPSTDKGTITALHFSVGDQLTTGDPLITVEVLGDEEKPSSADARASNGSAIDNQTLSAKGKQPAAVSTDPNTTSEDKSDYDYDLVVIGAGPGGYAAAFRGADLGLNVAIIEKYPTLGGVCLNVGCIPSKALLHLAKLINEAKHSDSQGISFGPAKVDIDGVRTFKEKVVKTMTGGLSMMAKKRKVSVIQGIAEFTSTHTFNVVNESKNQSISFNHAIVAAGSRVVKLPFFPWDDERVMDSTDALELADIPKKMLIVGGGIIGLEMATVYTAFGSKVDVVELSPSLMVGADTDLVRTYTKYNKNTFENVYLNTQVTAAKTQAKGIEVTFEGEKAPKKAVYDRILVAVGRRPNSDLIGADKIGLNINEKGFIPVDKQMRTNIDNIFAIGDIVGQPMLAHKATHEGHVAAEVIAGEKTSFVASVIPAVAYTDPEVAWVGLTELQAKEQGIAYQKAVFPWAASGRATAMGRNEGFTKLLFDPKTDRVLGGGIVGISAGDLIGEVVLAIEMQSDAHDVGLTIHPHPTLTESVGMTAETYLGTITDLIAPKKR